MSSTQADALQPRNDGSSSTIATDGTGDDAAMSEPVSPEPPDDSTGLLLDATRDARQIIRLVQCPICSNILQDATTLPCGTSICRTCLPRTRLRMNITWPATEDRLRGFDCPMPDCGKEHAADDCALDITLNKVLAIFKTVFPSYQSAKKLSELSTHVTVRDQWGVAGLPSLEEKQSASRVLGGGRILATYALAELGELDYTGEVLYSPVGAGEDEVSDLDGDFFLKLKESVRTEMDCQVCYALYLDPMTTTCGHTYCRTCVDRILDHSNLCPICRRKISMQAQAHQRAAPSNNRLASMINGFWADLIDLRSQSYKLEQQANQVGFDIPLFVCTLAFPEMPLFLHVFEPRYRLMIRRAMESDRMFGMVLASPTFNPNEPSFMELGTLMRIIKIEYLVDGRSVIEAVGLSRFKTTRHGMLDGYVVANIEKVDDISLAEEERLEANEIQHATDTAAIEDRPSSSESTGADSAPEVELPSTTVPVANLDSIPTQELVNVGVEFVRKMQAESVDWLAAQIRNAYGECPEDAATFPWWFACVFPVSTTEKYRLLTTLSVRERLIITCRWIAEWEVKQYQWSVDTVS
ncbi:ATP-dependent protease La domain-containing protein [Astrocystis sublimbata]|nr:ATP-dependent protease La domain-containing protein [Astrocystis sublimbata]